MLYYFTHFWVYGLWFYGMVIGNHSLGSGGLCLLRAALLGDLRYGYFSFPVVFGPWGVKARRWWMDGWVDGWMGGRMDGVDSPGRVKVEYDVVRRDPQRGTHYRYIFKF